MPYSASDIAKHILTLSNPEVGDIMSNLKLQKLLYYVQGFHLAMHDGQPLFNEEVYAWQYGPVVPEVYQEYKHLGSSAIPVPENLELQIDKDAADLIKEVYDVYGQFSALKLMDMTHDESPWRETQINGVIKPELMHSYFKSLVND